MWVSPIVPLVSMALSVVAGLCPAARRKDSRGSLLYAVGGLGLFAVFLLLDSLLVDMTTAWTTLEPLFCALAGFLFGRLVLRMRGGESIFAAVWAQIVSELSTQFLMLSVGNAVGIDSAAGKAFHLFWIAAACLVLYHFARGFLFRRLTRNGAYRMDGKKTVLALCVLLVFLALSNYQVIFWLLGEGGERGGAIIPVFRMVVGVSALLLLYLQNSAELRLEAQRELDIAHQLQTQREEQFRVSSENIALINQKCHDLKHQIAALLYHEAGLFSPRLGHATALTCHRHVIHSRGDALLPLELPRCSIVLFFSVLGFVYSLNQGLCSAQNFFKRYGALRRIVLSCS